MLRDGDKKEHHVWLQTGLSAAARGVPTHPTRANPSAAPIAAATVRCTLPPRTVGRVRKVADRRRSAWAISMQFRLVDLATQHADEPSRDSQSTLWGYSRSVMVFRPAS